MNNCQMFILSSVLHLSFPHCHCHFQCKARVNVALPSSFCCRYLARVKARCLPRTLYNCLQPTHCCPFEHVQQCIRYFQLTPMRFPRISFDCTAKDCPFSHSVCVCASTSVKQKTNSTETNKKNDNTRTATSTVESWTLVKIWHVTQIYSTYFSNIMGYST